MTTATGRRLWVITECYPRPGALTHCIFAHRQLKGVQQAGWDVTVLRPNGWFPPALWRLAPGWRAAKGVTVGHGFELDGIVVRDLAYRNRVPGRLNGPHDMARLIEMALDAHLHQVGAGRAQDVLNVQFALPYGSLVRRAAQCNGLHYTVHLRGDDVWIWPHVNAQALREFRDTVRDASAVFAVSEAILAEARRLCEAPLPQAIVVPNGIELSHFRPPTADERSRARAELSLEPVDLAVICVATAIARKGWRELLQAVEGSVGAHGVVIAASTGAADLDLAAERPRLAPRVRLMSRQDVDRDSLIKLYHAADVFCLPSHGEGLSNALLEAMACGLPVITTPVGGHPEVVTAGVQGHLVPVADVPALTGALSDLLSNAHARQSMGAAGRRAAEAIGTSRDNGARVGAVLDTLTAESATPAAVWSRPILGAVT
jgi:glycosyltransferase involved in cell wall biosynthesis